MKLHLPRALRSALLACITAVAGLTTTVSTGFVAGGVMTLAFSVATASVAKADDDTLLSATCNSNVTFTVSAESSGWSVSHGTGVNEMTLPDKTKSETLSSMTDGTYNSGYLRPNTNVGSGGTWTLNFALTNSSGKSAYVSEITFNCFLFNSSGEKQNETVKRVIDFTVGDKTVEFTLVGSSNNSVVIDIPDIVLANGATYDFSLTVSRNPNEGLGTFVGLQSIDFKKPDDLYWQDNDGGEWNSTAAAWTTAATTTTPLAQYLPGVTAHFTGAAGTSTEINVTEDVTAYGIVVSGADYTFNLTESLTTNGLIQIAEGSSLAVSGTGTLVLGHTIQNAGNVTLGGTIDLYMAGVQGDVVVDTEAFYGGKNTMMTSEMKYQVATDASKLTISNGTEWLVKGEAVAGEYKQGAYVTSYMNYYIQEADTTVTIAADQYTVTGGANGATLTLGDGNNTVGGSIFVGVAGDFNISVEKNATVASISSSEGANTILSATETNKLTCTDITVSGALTLTGDVLSDDSALKGSGTVYIGGEVAYNAPLEGFGGNITLKENGALVFDVAAETTKTLSQAFSAEEGATSAGIVKTGAGTLELTGEVSSMNIDVREGTLWLGTIASDSKTYGFTDGWTGDVSLADNTTLAFETKGESHNTAVTIGTFAVGDGTAEADVTLKNAEPFALTINKVTGKGTINLTRDTNSRRAALLLKINGEDELSDDSFTGTWNVAGYVTLHAMHKNSLAGSDIILDDNLSSDAVRMAVLQLAADTVNINSLSGTKGKVEVTGRDSATLVMATKGEANFAGTIGAGVAIVMNGEGTQVIKSVADPSISLTVNKGTLSITDGVTTEDGRAVTIAQGATLATDLTLNGGSLTLDASTGTAPSLGGNALTMGADKTDLTLLVPGTAVSGTALTLLTGIDSCELGADALLSTYFNLTGITLVGEGGVVAADAASDLEADWIDRLNRSALSFDLESGSLKLTLAPLILSGTTLYWEPSDNGDGSWKGASWSATDKDPGSVADPGVLETPWPADKLAPSVVFSGDGTVGTPAQVNVDMAAVVTDMEISGGFYTFSGDGKLTIGGELTVAADGSADISALSTVLAKDVSNAGSLTADTIQLTGGELTQSNSTAVLKVQEVTGQGAVKLTGGTLEGAIAGTDKVTVTIGGIKVASGTEAGIQNATLISSITSNGKTTFSGNIHIDTVNGTFVVDNLSTYSESPETDIELLGLTTGDGYITRKEEYTVATGTVEDSATWTVGAGNTVGEYKDGKVEVSVEKDLTTYWVNNSVTQSKVVLKDGVTTKYMLNGGTLLLDGAGLGDMTIETNNENPLGTDSTVSLGDDFILDSSKLTVKSGTTVTLSGSGTYDMSDLDVPTDGVFVLPTGVSLDTTADNDATTDVKEGWTGTVQLGDIEMSGTVDVTRLVDSDSSVSLGSIKAAAMIVDSTYINQAKLHVIRDATLDGGSSALKGMYVRIGGNLSLGETSESSFTANELNVYGAEGITLGKDSELDIAGSLNVHNGSLKAGNNSTVKAGAADIVKDLTLGQGSTVTIDYELVVDGAIVYTSLNTATPQITAGSWGRDTLKISLADSLIREAADKAPDITQPIATLMTVTSGSDAVIKLNGGSNIVDNYGGKYDYALNWAPSASPAASSGTDLQLTAQANPNYMKEKYAGGTPNGLAGATIMDDAFANNRIGTTGDLAAILAGVDAGTITDKDLAAVAGSSTATLGMALAGDVERQLRAIRNRTTTMGVNQCVVNEGMPYFNAWVNAEGNLGELDQDSTYAGYRLDSWGGTVGFDVDVNPSLTLGLAVTAMFGDMTVDGPDMLEGDMDTCYVTAFARYAKRAWTHTFIGTVGTMDGSYERTVTHANGKYTTKGDTDGTAFGLMYEVARTFAIDDDGDACWQPVFNVAYRHASVGGYKEEGKDAALKVDDQTLNTVTFGAGARLQAVVGENLYNRTSVLELRALAKLDAGDRSSEADVAFIGGGRKATVESAELGAFGVELGAGLSIPLGDEDSGTLFFDVSAELRSGYSNVNGTVGYRINF